MSGTKLSPQPKGCEFDASLPIKKRKEIDQNLFHLAMLFAFHVQFSLLFNTGYLHRTFNYFCFLFHKLVHDTSYWQVSDFLLDIFATGSSCKLR